MADDTTQVDRNHEVYTAKYKQELERSDLGRTALMHDGEIIEIYDESVQAYMAGVNQYGLGEFSIVKIGRRPVDLGILAGATLSQAG